MPKKKKPEKDLEDVEFEEDDGNAGFEYEEALNTILASPQAQALFGKASNLLDGLGGLLDKAIKGQPVAKEQPAAKPKVSAREILHFGPKEVLTEEKIKARKKALARLVHPDAGGSDQEMARINLASELLLKGLKKK